MTGWGPAQRKARELATGRGRRASTFKGPRSRRDKEQKKAEQGRLEAALEAGLEGTFPASDARRRDTASTRAQHLIRYCTLLATG